ncbi:MAG: hypothetical protein JXB05_30005, partial [Myxococcaceae bacterium]|nr:hypothetical protein [Myxococcaceae bacterium]
MRDLSHMCRVLGFVLLLVLSGGCDERRRAPEAPSITASTYETHDAFPIAEGLHAKVDCNTCHGDFDSFRQFTCLDCHDHSRETTDPRHMRVPDYGWESTRCYECHPAGEATGVDHTGFFPIGQGSLHAGITCATCHVDPKSRKVVDCTSCHSHVASQTDPLHNGIPGYAFTSPKCLECHPQSTIP